MMSKLKKINLISIIVMLILGIVCTASAEEWTVVKTVYLDRGEAINPKFIVEAQDKGLIIIGNKADLDHTYAWATKTDSEGKILWSYSTPSLNKEEIRPVWPDYESAAVMPDDSVFLCGSMPLSKGVGRGLLTHLDKNGKVLSEALISPEGLNGGGSHSCMAWNNGVLYVGSLFTQGKIDGAIVPAYFYWVVYFDAHGKKKWEKLVPLAEKEMAFNVDGTSQLQGLEDGDAVIAARRNTIATEVLLIKKNRDIAKKLIAGGGFIAVLSSQKLKEIQLVSTGTEKLTRITLDKDLEEIARATEPNQGGWVYAAYLLPDQSLALFGNRDDHKHMLYDSARVLIVDSNLKNGKSIILGEKFDSANTQAGVVLDESGGFIAMRWSQKHGEMGINAPANAHGVALDFIKLKQ